MPQKAAFAMATTTDRQRFMETFAYHVKCCHDTVSNTRDHVETGFALGNALHIKVVIRRHDAPGVCAPLQPDAPFVATEMATPWVANVWDQCFVDGRWVGNRCGLAAEYARLASEQIPDAGAQCTTPS